MELIGSIVGGASSLLGGIFGGKAQRKAYRAALQQYQDRMDQIRAHRDNVYYQDPTQTAESQAAVTQARELLGEQAKRASATKAVTGGTDEGVALQKQAAAKAAGDILSNAAVQGAAKREALYQTGDQAITQMNNYIASTKLDKGLSKAKAITEAAGSLAGVANELDF